MKIHPLALSALLAVASVTSTDAFVVTSPKSTPTDSNSVLKRLQSVVAEASPVTTRLSAYQDYYEDYSEEYYEESEGVILDANDESVYYEEEFMSSSLNLAEADESTIPPQELSETPVSPPLATAAGEAALSAFGASGFSAGVSAGALAFGGLAVARTALGQRQKKLDEEKRNLEEQQKRLETESAKLQRDTSTNNLFLSTIGSVAVGTALTTGGLVEEFTQSTVRSLEGIGEGINLENGIKESVKGGGFKTTAGTVVERPALIQEELPYLESKIEQEATKQQTKERAAKFLNNRRQKLTVKQNELESMAAKREAAIATEEARLQAIAEQEGRLQAEEESLRRQMLADQNEAARLQKQAEEAEAARVKAAEEARIKKEAEEAKVAQMKAAEEARIQAEQQREAERLRILEEESKEQARQEAMAREQRSLEILRQREEQLAIQQQRSTSSTATAAGASVLRDYASRFNSEFYANGLSTAIDTEKVQLLLNQLGISPGIVGGAAALLVFGSGATAIKNLLDEAEENSETTSSRDIKDIKAQEEDLSSQVAKLLEKKREENAQQSSTVRKTLKISSQGEDDESPSQKTQAPKSNSVPPAGITPSAQAPPSIKFGESTPQPNVTPPVAKSNGSAPQAPLSSSPGSPSFGTPAGANNNGFPSSKVSSNPFGNKIPQSPSSSTSNFGVSPPAKKNFSVSSPKQPSVSSSSDRPGFGSLPTKNANAPNFAPPKTFGSPPKKTAGISGKQGASPFGISSKTSFPGKQPASPFGTSAPKEKSGTSFGSPPPKSTKLPDKVASSPFGIASSNKQTPFGASAPTGFPEKKSMPPFNPSMKKVPSPFREPKSSPFGTASSKTGPPKAFGSPPQKSADFGSKVGGSPFKQGNSPFDTGLGQASQGKSAPSFGTSPPKGPPASFGSPTPKSKVGEPTFKQANSPFGTAPKKFSLGKDPVSPFGPPTSSNGPSSPFGSPLPTKVEQPVKKTASPFGNISKAPPSRFTPKEGTVNNDEKKPFSPFGQRSAPQNKPKPSFSSSGPVYMPPTSKANNAAPLKNVYSSLGSNQNNGSQEKRIREFNEKTPPTTSGPKKSFSPFGETKGIPKSSSGQGINMNDPNASLQPSPFAEQVSKKSFSPFGSKPSVSAQDTEPNSSSFAAAPFSSTATTSPQNGIPQNGIKKSFSPYGRKPKGRDENLPKVDPSSFSFGAPPSQSSPSQDPNDPTTNGSSSFGPSDASPKPFAATGFPPRGEDFESARNRAIRDEQP